MNDQHDSTGHTPRMSRRAAGAAALLGAAAVALHAEPAAAGATSGILIVDTVAELLLLPVGSVVSGAPHRTALVLGYHAPNDGGGGLFYWDAGSTLTPDRGTIFRSLSSPTGRWLRAAV